MSISSTVLSDKGTNQTGTAITSLATATGVNVSAGDLAVVMIRTGDNVTHSAPTDNDSGNTYVQVGSKVSTTNNTISMWRCVLANAKTGYKVTGHWGTDSYVSVDVLYFHSTSGWAAAPVDKTVSGQTSSSPATSGATGVLAQAEEVAVYGGSYDNNNCTFSANNNGMLGATGVLGVTSGSSSQGDTGMVYRILSATTSGTMAFALSGSPGELNGIGATFKTLTSVSGTLSATLAALTLAATMTASVSASAAPTLADVTLASTVTTGNNISGSLSQTLDALTASATGTVSVSASVSATLAALTCSATGKLPEYVVATRGHYPTDKTSFGSNFNAKSYHYVRGGSVTNIRLHWDNAFCATGGVSEAATGSSLSLQASVEYPAGTYTRVTFGGSNTGTAASGSRLSSDPIPLSIPQDAKFTVHEYVTAASNVAICLLEDPTILCDVTGGDAVDTVTGTNQVMGGAVTDRGSGSWFGPIGITGSSTSPYAVGLAGNSRIYGYRDHASDATNHGDIGEVAPSIGAHWPYVNFGISGDKALSFATSGYATRRLSFLNTYCNVIITDYGVNDIIADGTSAATTLTRAQAVWAKFTAGQAIYGITFTPWSTDTGSTNWTTTAGQTSQGAAAINGFNDSIRGGGVGLTGYFEVADTMMSAHNSDKWVCPSAVAQTDDGVHCNPTGYARIAAAGVIALTYGVSGTLASTLDAATCSATGTVSVSASASPTLGAVTSAATATVSVSASASPTLANLTVTGAATAAVSGTLSQTLDALTGSATATAAVSATTAATLDAVTLAASGTVVAGVSGSLSATLDAASLAGSGTVAVSGSLAASLGSLTASGAGTVTVSATSAQTLGAATVAGSGTVSISGSVSQTLAAASLAATGSVINGIGGEVNATLDALTVTSAGAVSVSAALSSTLGVLTASASATAAVSATSNPTLGAATLAATGTAAVAGQLSATLGAATLDASATVTVVVSGSLNQTLAALTASAAGTVSVSAAATPTLAAVTSAATGTVSVGGALTATLGGLTCAGTATVAVTGSCGATLAAVTSTASGTAAVSGSTAATLSAAALSSTAAVGVAAQLSTTLGGVTLAASGLVQSVVHGSLNVTLGTLTLTGVATVVPFPHSIIVEHERLDQITVTAEQLLSLVVADERMTTLSVTRETLED